MNQAPVIAVGRKVPDFTASSTAGEFRLSQLRGRIAVLYFYPKDNTPGCTTESNDFAAADRRFAAAGAVVVGVSRDSLASHERFRARFELPFVLLSDPEEALCALFGVMKQKNMYGKSVRGIERSTFVIDAQGLLRHEWRGVKVPGHVDEVLQAVRALA
jgi:thioredoxin-dependent peroxiredoxin